METRGQWGNILKVLKEKLSTKNPISRRDKKIKGRVRTFQDKQKLKIYVVKINN